MGKTQTEPGSGHFSLAEQRSAVLRQITAAGQMVCRHQLKRLRADNLDAVKRTAVQQHAAEPVIVRQCRGEAAAARLEFVRPRPRAFAAGLVRQFHLFGRVPRIGWRNAVSLVGSNDKSGIVHPQRAKDVGREIGPQRHPRNPRHDDAAQIGCNRVVPARTGIEFERQLGQLGDKFVVVVLAPDIHITFAISSIDVGAVLKTIGKAGRVAHQIHDPRRRCGRTGHERAGAPATGENADVLELGEIFRDRLAKRDLALLDKLHQRDRRDRLGHRHDPENRIIGHP